MPFFDGVPSKKGINYIPRTRPDEMKESTSISLDSIPNANIGGKRLDLNNSLFHTNKSLAISMMQK